MNLVESVQNEFNTLIAAAGGSEKSFRQQAWAEYSRLGLPGRKTEAWKYSNLNAITKAEFNPRSPSPAALAPLSIQLKERYQNEFDVLVIADGQLRLESSLLSAELKACVQAPAFGSPPRFDDGFTSLSAAVSRPALRLEIPAGVRLLRPVLLLRVQGSQSVWTSAYSEIHLGPGAALNLVELFTGAANFLRMEVTQALLSSGARMGWLRIQEDGPEASHFSDVQIGLDEAAFLHLDQIQLGAAWSRTGLRVDLGGQQSEAVIQGIGFGRAHQHIDQRIEVNHLSADTRSTQLFKSVLKDHARGVVNGKIFIAQDAQRVASAQMNHSLLLSPGAEADTKPELEIYADDVKANHGASVGRLDEEKLFYLISRGIPRPQAQQMLAHAFVGDVLMKIDNADLRRLAEDRVQAQLPDFITGMKT